MLKSYLHQSAQLIQTTAEKLDERLVDKAVFTITAALKSGKPLLICGNGGSAADAMHITGELVGRFLKERKAIKAICLSSNPAVLTAWGNDYSFETIFSRQVEAYGEQGAVLLGLSTSGNSWNVIEAFKTAKHLSMTTIALTGEEGGELAEKTDILLDVPSKETPLIQQVHLCLYHYLCARIEESL